MHWMWERMQVTICLLFASAERYYKYVYCAKVWTSFFNHLFLSALIQVGGRCSTAQILLLIIIMVMNEVCELCWFSFVPMIYIRFIKTSVIRFHMLQLLIFHVLVLNHALELLCNRWLSYIQHQIWDLEKEPGCNFWSTFLQLYLII